MSDDPLAKAERRGKEAVRDVALQVGANDSEINTIGRIERLTRHGYHSIDLRVRKDGQDYWFEADWLARLFRAGGFRK